jgi:hypothetical protein
MEQQYRVGTGFYAIRLILLCSDNMWNRIPAFRNVE